MSNAFTRMNAAASNPWFTGLVGLVAGLSICYVALVRPLQGQVDRWEEWLKDWEQINRMEREAVATMKTLSTEELRKWVATIEEQNGRYAQLQSRLHQQELELAGPATTHLVIAVLAVLAVLVFVAFLLRDSNAEAARTLHNAVAVLPALSQAVHDRHAVAPERAEKPKLAQGLAITEAAGRGQRRRGTVAKYFEDRSYGYIAPEGSGPEVFFHKRAVSGVAGQRLRPGVAVTFEDGKDRQGRGCAKRVQIED